MSQEPTIATAVAESGPEVSAADLRAGPTQHLAVEPLREVTTPSVLLTRGLSADSCLSVCADRFALHMVGARAEIWAVRRSAGELRPLWGKPGF